MPAAVLVVLLGASAVLVVEFLMTAAAGLAGLRQGMERFTHLTGLAPGRSVYRALGALALLGVAGIVAGLRWPALAIAGAAYFALLSGFTLVRQARRGQRGGELFPYALFLTSSAAVIAIRALYR